MIALKPYRETHTAHDKGEKKRLGGRIRTGRVAYPWYKHAPILNLGVIFFITVPLGGIVLSLVADSPEWMLISGFIVLVGLLLINPLWMLYLSRRIGQPTLHVSSERVGRGDTFTIEFHQPFHRACVVQSVTIHLMTREWVRYKCGTDVCTDTRDKTIQRIYNRNRELQAGDHYERRAEFRIPEDAMHSFAFNDNSLTWLIRVTLTIKDFMPLTETYALQVTPEVHTL